MLDQRSAARYAAPSVVVQGCPCGDGLVSVPVYDRCGRQTDWLTVPGMSVSPGCVAISAHHLGAHECRTGLGSIWTDAATAFLLAFAKEAGGWAFRRLTAAEPRIVRQRRRGN